MRRKLILLTAAAILSTSAANSTQVILEDTPNVGDTTVITTVTSGNPATTGNLVSQDFDVVPGLALCFLTVLILTSQLG